MTYLEPGAAGYLAATGALAAALQKGRLQVHTAKKLMAQFLRVHYPNGLPPQDDVDTFLDTLDQDFSDWVGEHVSIDEAVILEKELRQCGEWVAFNMVAKEWEYRGEVPKAAPDDQQTEPR